MPKFIQKLVTVEALQFTGKNIPEILKFCSICFQEGEELRMHRQDLGKDMPEDMQRSFAITKGSWVMRTPDGKFVPCSEAFLDFYEPVKEPAKKK